MSKKLASLSILVLVALVFALFPIVAMAAAPLNVNTTLKATQATTETVTTTEVATKTETVTKTEMATKTETAPVAKTETVTATETATKTETAPAAKTETVTKTETAPAVAGAGKTYTIQKDDWLSKIADKEYKDILAYKAIVKYNNDKAATDKAITKIENPDMIEVGWTIYLPTADEVKAFMATAAPVAPAKKTEAVTKTETATKTETTPVAKTEAVTKTETVTKPETVPASDVLAPQKGRCKLFLFNEFKDELTFTINGKEHKVPVGGFEKMVTVDMDAGKYTYTISIHGGSVNGEVEMAPDQSWSVGVRADGAVYNPMKVYPK